MCTKSKGIIDGVACSGNTVKTAFAVAKRTIDAKRTGGRSVFFAHGWSVMGVDAGKAVCAIVRRVALGIADAVVADTGFTIGRFLTSLAVFDGDTTAPNDADHTVTA